MTPAGALMLSGRVAVVRKKLRRRGNSIDLHLSPELLFALGLDIRDAGDAEVDIVLVADGLLVKPVAGAERVPGRPMKWRRV